MKNEQAQKVSKPTAKRRVLNFILDECLKNGGSVQISRKTIMAEVAVSVRTVAYANKELKAQAGWKVENPGGSDVTTYAIVTPSADKD